MSLPKETEVHTMAKRNLLHISKLEQFTLWLTKQGFNVEENAAVYEVIRWKVKNKPMPIIYWKHDAKEHYVCNEHAVPFVKSFLKQSNKRSTHA